MVHPVAPRVCEDPSGFLAIEVYIKARALGEAELHTPGLGFQTPSALRPGRRRKARPSFCMSQAPPLK
eukprot:4798237-Alexandrium_andersonii.AAC.1